MLIKKYYEHCFACAVAALGGVDRRLGRHIVLHVCVSLSASTHRRLPRQNAARLSARFRLLPVRDAVLSAHMPDPVVSAFIAGFSCLSIALFGPANHPELHLSEKELKALQPRIYIRLLIVVALTAVLFYFSAPIGVPVQRSVFCGCVITCNLVARLWCTIALYYQTLGEKNMNTKESLPHALGRKAL